MTRPIRKNTIAQNRNGVKLKKAAVPDHISVAIEKLEELRKGPQEKDECDYFGMKIAHQLRSLSLDCALNCQGSKT